MKRGLIGSLLVLTLSACQQKIGYVDNSKLLDEYQEKKDLESLLKGKIDKYERKRDSISRVFQLTEEQQAIQEESRIKMDTLLKKVKTFIKEYGKKHNYDFILGANDGGSVHYGKEDKDITKEIIKELNEKK